MNNGTEQQLQPVKHNLFFEDMPVRLVIDERGEPWFVAKDVCDILELVNSREALKGLDDDELASEKLTSGGQLREMNLVSESGLYTLVIRSNKPQAKPFRRWVTHEVLPSIRKTGSYSLPSLAGASAMEAMAAQIIQMVVPAVISQVMQQIQPMVGGIQDRISRLQVNFSHVGNIWSFAKLCCQEGNSNAYVAKDELYAAYRAYCAALHSTRAEGKSAFLTKLYHAFLNTHAGTVSKGGRKVQVVQGMTLLPGYEVIIEDHQRQREERDAQELANRREWYANFIKPAAGEAEIAGTLAETLGMDKQS
ncbi:MAG: BRO-N domain-containing protein [Desulfobulbaceae bacterium]